MKQSVLGQFFAKRYPDGIVPTPPASSQNSNSIANLTLQQPSQSLQKQLASSPSITQNSRTNSAHSSASKKTPKKEPLLLTASDEQHNIINESKSNHIEIKACAGSGKTTTILQRVKQLLEREHVRPEKILITAFNVDAARNVKQKLRRLLNNERVEKQLCVNNIDKLSKQWVISARKYNIDTLSVSEFTTKLVAILNSDASFRSRITAQFDYIFFDEFQDINPDEYELLKIFAANSTIITLVGDDAQNIYGFREAKVAVSPAQLEADFPGIQHHTLTTNYRSIDPIVQFANNVLANSKLEQLSAMHMKPSPANLAIKNTKKPEFTKFMSIAEQNDAIISHVRELVESGVSLDSIAVLSRANKPLQFLEEALEMYNNRITKAAATQTFKHATTNLFNVNSHHDQNSLNKPKHSLIPYVAHISDNNDKQGQMKFKKATSSANSSSSNNNSTKPQQLSLLQQSQSSSRLTLTTIHKAKGLEWDVVFLIGLNDDFFPGTNKEKELEEERRVFYVGVTRARRFLEMSFVWSKKAQNATRFVAEIPNDIYSGYTPPLISEQPRCNEQMRMIDKLKAKTLLLSETLEFLTKGHYEELRNMGCFDAIAKDSAQIHFKCSLGTYIIENNLVMEFAHFFKAYLIRSISEEIQTNTNLSSQSSHSFGNGFTSKFCHTVLFAQTMASLPAGFEQQQQQQQQSMQGFQVNFAKDSRLMSSLYIGEQQKREEILRSLVSFQDRASKSDSILKQIFNVAMCQSIFYQRKRLLHKDDAFKHFELNKNILKNAKKSFLPEVFRSYPTMHASMSSVDLTENANIRPMTHEKTQPPSIENICLNESLFSEDFQLKAEFDVITHDTIFEIRFVQSLSNIKPEDTIELLAKAGILESAWKIRVRFIVIYYPLQGELVTLDIHAHAEKLNAVLKVLYAARLDKQEACSIGTKSPSSSLSSSIHNSSIKLNHDTKNNNSSLLSSDGGEMKSHPTQQHFKSHMNNTTRATRNGKPAFDFENETEEDYEISAYEQKFKGKIGLKQKSLYERYGEDSYADMCEDYDHEGIQQKKQVHDSNKGSYPIRGGRMAASSFSGMARGLHENNSNLMDTGSMSGFATAAATFANKTQSQTGSSSFVSAASIAGSIPQSVASSQSKPIERLQSKGVSNSVQLFQQAKRLNNFNSLSSSSNRNNNLNENSNSGSSFNYGSSQESHEQHKRADDDIENEEQASSKTFGGFIKASDIAGTKQSIQLKKSTSQKLKVFNDVALMNKVQKPMIGSKAAAPTLSKADSYESFKYQHGSFKRNLDSED